MTSMATRGARVLVLLALASLVAACGLPRSGPTKSQILQGSVTASGDAHIVAIDDHVARATSAQPSLGFSEAFQSAGVVGSDTIRPGDVLGLTVWENVDEGVLSGAGQNAAVLEEVQVDSAGFIFVPYAGRIRAAGNTPEALRRTITRQLETQTPDPQVAVRRLAGDGATVSVMGGVGAQGVYPIERPTRTLSAMLARAGGVSLVPEIAQITVIRGSHQGRVWLQDLYKDPRMDIALRPDDRILVEADTRAFTAIGATGAQNRVQFESQTLSAIEAIARVGGLNSALADPTGIFVFRTEGAAVANAVLGRNDIMTDQRMVYVLDLTEPTGIFLARDFQIRDEDTVYVTEAPYVQWQKTLSAFTGALGTANTVDSLAGNN